jgi:hypothetical protein
MKNSREAIDRARRVGLANRFALVLNDRGLEWYSSFVMLGWGLTLALPGDTLAAPQYAAFQRFGFTEEFWSWAFTLMGTARLIALFINGKWPRSPMVRMVGSAFGAVSWSQVAYLLTIGTFGTTGIPATGTVVYGLLAIADLFGIARAAFDARYYSP